jgi:hypothetical protein
MVGMDGNGDDMPISGEDEIAQKWVFLLLAPFAHIDPKGAGMKPVKLDKSHPIVGGLGKGKAFDLEDPVQIGKRERTNHGCLFIPEMMEAMPKVNPRERMSFNPDRFNISA